jgi:hypothetical protein
MLDEIARTPSPGGGGGVSEKSLLGGLENSENTAPSGNTQEKLSAAARAETGGGR